MIAVHVHDALQQVRDLRREVLESRQFEGYSGNVRIFTGFLALSTAIILVQDFYPQTLSAHFLGWITLAAIGIAANYGALLKWFLFRRAVRRNPGELMPTVDALPPLFVGGLLTAGLVMQGSYHLLFGIWMCCYGLANLASRRVLPSSIWPVGLFYIGSGSICLLHPDISFLKPWPMAAVFFVGEIAGGAVFTASRIPDCGRRP